MPLYPAALKIRNVGSPGVAVMNHQFWQQLQCHPPVVQLRSIPVGLLA
jgi:hypothetical protein